MELLGGHEGCGGDAVAGFELAAKPEWRLASRGKPSMRAAARAWASAGPAAKTTISQRSAWAC